MGATLDALQQLQQVELRLKALRSKIDQKKRAVRIQERRQAQGTRELEMVHAEIMRQQAAIDQLDLEVKSRDEHTTKLRETLNKTKTNKEYAAILSEINTGKADTGKLEDSVLEMMSSLEVTKARQEPVQQKLDKDIQGGANAKKVAEAFEHDSQAELKMLEDARSEAASELPHQTLKIFERTADHHDGEALARIIQPHPKRQEHICDGCNMGVTLEQFVRVQSQDQIELCQSCGRMLFIDEKAR